MALRLLAVVAAVAGACAAGASASAPPGATAQCRDGSYSDAVHHQGACSHHGGVAAWLDGGGTAAGGAGIAVGSSVLLHARTRSAACLLGATPDRRCSPGAYYSALTAAAICNATFRTSTIRHVTTDTRHAVELEYGLAARAYGHTLEIDHIVPLELGGSNGLANLFPERAPGYRAKDRLENALHERVCEQRMRLHTAQTGIAADWENLYRRIFGVTPYLTSADERT